MTFEGHLVVAAMIDLTIVVEVDTVDMVVEAEVAVDATTIPIVDPATTIELPARTDAVMTTTLEALTATPQVATIATVAAETITAVAMTTADVMAVATAVATVVVTVVVMAVVAMETHLQGIRVIHTQVEIQTTHLTIGTPVVRSYR